MYDLLAKQRLAILGNHESATVLAPLLRSGRLERTASKAFLGSEGRVSATASVPCPALLSCSVEAAHMPRLLTCSVRAAHLLSRGCSPAQSGLLAC